MTSSPSLRLKVGERIWYDGQAWTVREVSSQAADLVAPKPLHRWHGELT